MPHTFAAKLAHARELEPWRNSLEVSGRLVACPAAAASARALKSSLCAVRCCSWLFRSRSCDRSSERRVGLVGLGRP
eukprot:4070572-Pleurochrysis_carterae.AAC.1